MRRTWDELSLKGIIAVGVAVIVTIHFSAALFGLYRQEQGLRRVETAIHQSRENEKLIRDVREIGRVVVAVTSCTPQDAGETCQEKLRRKSIEEGQERLKAVHCIVRSVREGDPPTRTEQRCTP